MDRNDGPDPTYLDAHGLVQAMSAYRALLSRHEATINRLNVFPVPDGDTGTNMLLTVTAVVAEIGSLVADGVPELPVVCGAIAHGSLMGARGNSGVILCQVLRGLTEVLSSATEGMVDANAVAQALAAGAAAARSAVLRPAEGTILSVADAAGTSAVRSAASGARLVEVLGEARRGALEALWRTPSQLPVLAQAGVVDAGGAGLLLAYDALLEVVGARTPPEQLDLPPEVWSTLASSAARQISTSTAGSVDDGALRYEVMYLLSAPDESIPAFKEVWAGVGDSIVVVGGGGLWNCHIHTDDIGAAIEAALDAGRPRDIRVTDLAEQVDEEQWVREGGTGAGAPLDLSGEAPHGGAPPVTSVVAVATGDGIRRIFRSLGVAAVVAGGQSMNPSTVEMLAAIDSVPGAEVVLLPNNSNIRPVAEQAAGLATKQVRVVATRGIQEGFAALLEYDPQATGEDNATAMAAAAGRIVAGEVTRAVRASDSPVGAVAAGDYIGLSRSGIESVAPTLARATCGLLDRLVSGLDDSEIVTLIEGKDARAAEVRRVTEWLREHHPELTVERLHGGQPLYPFLVSIE